MVEPLTKLDRVIFLIALWAPHDDVSTADLIDKLAASPSRGLFETHPYGPGQLAFEAVQYLKGSPKPDWLERMAA